MMLLLLIDIIIINGHHDDAMRTTLKIDDDVLDLAKSMAYYRKISVGDAISELARRGMNARVPMKRDTETGFLTFDVPPSAPVNITPEDIKRLEEEDDLERYHRAFGPILRPAKNETGPASSAPKKANDQR